MRKKEINREEEKDRDRAGGKEGRRGGGEKTLPGGGMRVLVCDPNLQRKYLGVLSDGMSFLIQRKRKSHSCRTVGLGRGAAQPED